MINKEILETIKFEDNPHVLIGIFEIKKEKRKPVYVRGGSIPVTFLNENQEQYNEHYGVNFEIRLLKEHFNIQGIIRDVYYEDNSILPKYEGVYILEDDFNKNKKALLKLKVRYVKKIISIINNDSQFYTVLFCIIGIVVIILLIVILQRVQ